MKLESLPVVAVFDNYGCLMPDIRADGVAVYVFRSRKKRGGRGQIEFLQLRRAAGDNAYRESWQVVYGGCRRKETAVQAALRELKEETGLAPIRMFQVEFLETFYFRLRDYVLVMPVFGVEVEWDSPITLNHEHTAIRWVPEKDIAKSFMWRTQREALGHVCEYLHNGSPAARYLEIELREGEGGKLKGKGP